jgi:hypothetical protein
MKKITLFLVVLAAVAGGYYVLQGAQRGARAVGDDHAAQPRRRRRHGRRHRHARSGRDRRCRHAGIRRRPGPLRRLQLDRAEGTGDRQARPPADRDADRTAEGQRGPRRRGSRAAARGARRRRAEAAARAADGGEEPHPAHRARDRRGERPIGRGADPLLRGRAHPGAGTAQQPVRQPGLHDHHRTHRRHRDLAQRGPGPDGRLEHERAHAVRHRRRPDEDAGHREHRRGRRRAHAPGPGRELPRGCIPDRDIPRRGSAGAPPAGLSCRTW